VRERALHGAHSSHALGAFRVDGGGIRATAAIMLNS